MIYAHIAPRRYDTSRGFTLVELLVVIAIIAILSSVVLASLGIGRYKGIDAAIQTDLHTIQNQAELYFSNNRNSYGTAQSAVGPVTSGPTYSASGTNFLISDTQANMALAGAISAGGTGYYAIGVSGASFAVAVSMKNLSGYWCVDSAGTAKLEATAPSLGGGAAAAVCP